MNQIKRFEVRNFKKLNAISVSDIGSINLITGDNNAGKTTLLEALLIDEDVNKSIQFLHRTLCHKNFHIHPERIHTKNPIFPKESYLKFLENDKTKPVSFEWEYNEGEVLSIGFQDCTIDELNEEDFKKRKEDNYNIGSPKNWIKIFKNGQYDELQWMYLDDFQRDLKYGYWPLIAFDAGYQDDINQYYTENIGFDEISKNENTKRDINQLELKFKTLDFEQKKIFISTLSMFIPDIEDTTIKIYYHRDILSIKTKEFDDYKPITFWGEGFNKFVRYLLEIIKCKGNRLMIDEIDTGIHWTKLKGFWKNIIEACLLNDVQLFATTHSKECIEAFAAASDSIFRTNDTDVSLKDKIRLIEIKEQIVDGVKKIYASTLDYEEILTSIDSNVNFRGGNLYE
jgi:AAA15 family ATPase/GTPase